MYSENNVIQDVGGRSRFFTSVFTWMFVGVLITAITAYGLVASGLAVLFLMNPVLVWVFFIAEFVLVFYISRMLGSEDMSSNRAKIAFVVYSIVNGITLSSIFFAYGIGLIYKAFVGSALMFGAMALLGHYTRIDLSKFSSILFMGLIGVLIMTFANFIFSFFGMYSGKLDVMLGYVTLFIFLGLTAWDIQKLKAMYNSTGNDQMLQTMAIYGALSLYLDFINLFLSLLRISGSRD